MAVSAGFSAVVSPSATAPPCLSWRSCLGLPIWPVAMAMARSAAVRCPSESPYLSWCAALTRGCCGPPSQRSSWIEEKHQSKPTNVSRSATLEDAITYRFPDNSDKTSIAVDQYARSTGGIDRFTETTRWRAPGAGGKFSHLRSARLEANAALSVCTQAARAVTGVPAPAPPAPPAALLRRMYGVAGLHGTTTGQ